MNSMLHTGKIVTPADELSRVYAEILDRADKPKEFSISFLPDLDSRIWGFKKRKLNVIAARPSQGKSIILLNMAYEFAKQGKAVVFFSFEMTIDECIERLISNYCDVDNFKLLTGRVVEDHATVGVRVGKLREEMDTLKLAIIEGMGKTFQDLFKTLQSFKECDAVFIDYIQQITPIKGNFKQDIDDYILKLREYAIKRPFCAVIGSQINRGTYDGSKIRPPEMHELKGSGNLEEVADMVILLHWQYWYDRDNEMKNNYWIRVAKNRGGRTGVFDSCYIYPEFYRICEDKPKGGQNVLPTRADWN